ncbi:MAG: lamin tail domain-containing protein [Candidatus Doudnabacteria bacterium]|nr:lamin tail domain-containing protein [Candidatus Doudnabacteria bacterium]
MGNVVLNGSNSLTIAGPVYIHGNLVIEQNTTITQDPAFGNQLASIIVDGTIDIDNNVNFSGNGSGPGSGAFLLVSNAAGQTGNNAAIEVSNDNSNLGDAVLYASGGDIHINSNRVILAAFAKHGTSPTNPAIDFDSNVQVAFRDLPQEIGCGAPIHRIQSVLINEFMPNPDGNDQGALGGELDGEWVELYNGMNVSVDVNNWAFYDNNNTHELIIGNANINSTTTIIQAGERLVVYRDGDADFELDNTGGDIVRLYNAPVGSGGVLVDSHSYTINASGNKSFARVPDGTASWIDPQGSPGEPNLEFFSQDTTPTEPVVFESEYNGGILGETAGTESGGGSVKGVGTESITVAQPALTEGSEQAVETGAVNQNQETESQNSETKAKEEPAILPQQPTDGQPQAVVEPPVNDPPTPAPALSE